MNAPRAGGTKRTRAVKTRKEAEATKRDGWIQRRSTEKRTAGESHISVYIVLAVEGTVTEPEYFRHIRKLYAEPIPPSKTPAMTIDRPFCHTGADPEYLLGKMVDYLKANPLPPTGRAWIVVDRDNWPIKSFNAIKEWAMKNPGYGVVMSNPLFELWVGLHHGTAAPTEAVDCVGIVKKHHYGRKGDKHLDTSIIGKSEVMKAVGLAKRKHCSQCNGNEWPIPPGQTTVYRILEHILSEHKKAHS